MDIEYSSELHMWIRCGPTSVRSGDSIASIAIVGDSYISYTGSHAPTEG
jgi:hypothetical protein